MTWEKRNREKERKVIKEKVNGKGKTGSNKTKRKIDGGKHWKKQNIQEGNDTIKVEKAKKARSRLKSKSYKHKWTTCEKQYRKYSKYNKKGKTTRNPNTEH